MLPELSTPAASALFSAATSALVASNICCCNCFSAIAACILPRFSTLSITRTVTRCTPMTASTILLLDLTISSPMPDNEPAGSSTLTAVVS